MADSTTDPRFIDMITSKQSMPTEQLKTLVEGAVSLLPEEQKTAYLEACAKAPDVVARESPPAKFFRAGDSADGRTSAARLCSYWRCRKQFFGDRAFLPMRLENGAMAPQDVEVLKAGFIKVLPDIGDGIPVLLWDPRVGDKPEFRLANLSKMRCAFYMTSVVSEKSDTLRTFRFDTGAKWSMQRGARANQMMLDFPFQSYQPHFVFLPDDRAKFETKCRPCLQQFFCENPGYAFCVGDTPAEVAQQLAKHGFRKEHLPNFMGGTWVENFDEWFRDRLAHETRQVAPSVGQLKTPPKAARCEQNRLPAKKRKAVTLESSAPAVEPLAVVSGAKAASATSPFASAEEERKRQRREWKRKMDALYARRRRKREKDDMDDLQNQVSTLSKKNVGLRQEEKCLIDLLTAAQAQVAVQTGEGVKSPTAKATSTAASFPLQAIQRPKTTPPAPPQASQSALAPTEPPHASFYTMLPQGLGGAKPSQAPQTTPSDDLLHRLVPTLQVPPQSQPAQQSSATELVSRLQEAVSTMQRKAQLEQLLTLCLQANGNGPLGNTISGLLQPPVSSQASEIEQLVKLLVALLQIPNQQPSPPSPKQGLGQLLAQLLLGGQSPDTSQTSMPNALLQQAAGQPPQQPHQAVLAEALLKALSHRN